MKPVEQITIRTANKSTLNRWQWFVKDLDGSKNVCLVAVDDNGEQFFYVVPGEIVKDRTTLQIDSHPKTYRGMLAQYLVGQQLQLPLTGE